MINLTKNSVLADRVSVADNFFTRQKGLLGREEFLRGEAMHIIPCNNIHSFFMKFSFDAFFIDRNGVIKRVEEDIKPWKRVIFCLSAHSVIELPAGTIRETDTESGDEIELVV